MGLRPATTGQLLRRRSRGSAADGSPDAGDPERPHGEGRRGPERVESVTATHCRLEQLRAKGFNAFLLDGMIWLVSTHWELTATPDRQTITCINTINGALERFAQEIHVQPIEAVTVPAHLSDLDDLALFDDVTITERAAHIARLIDRITEDDDGTQ